MGSHHSHWRNCAIFSSRSQGNVCAIDVLAWKTRLWRTRNLLSQPSEALNSGKLGLIKERPLSWIISLESGMWLCSHFSRIHITNWSSNSCWYDTFLPCPFWFLWWCLPGLPFQSQSSFSMCWQFLWCTPKRLAAALHPLNLEYRVILAFCVFEYNCLMHLFPLPV